MGASNCHGGKVRKKGQFVLDKTPLGKTGFAKVLKGKSKIEPDMIIVAKKFTIGKPKSIFKTKSATLATNMMGEEEVQELQDQTEKLCEFENHANIAKYHEWYVKKNSLYIVSDFVEGESLQKYFDSKNNELSEYEVCVVMKQLLQALEYCHEKGVPHRNIKPSNIMVTKDNNIVLVDFGLIRLTKKGQNIKLEGDEWHFIAPEYYKGTCDAKSDMWALGVLMYYLLSGKLPSSTGSQLSSFKKASYRNLSFQNPIWKDVSKESKNLIRKLIVGEPEKRYSATEALNHAWFSLDLDQLDGKKNLLVDQETLDKLRYNEFASKLQQVFIHLVVNLLLDDEEFNELQRKFSLIDTNNDGKLTLEELREMFKMVYSEEIPDEEITEIINKFTFDGKDSLNFNEFLTATVDKKLLADPGTLQDLFRGLDLDEDGNIDYGDVFKELQAIDTNLSKHDVEALVNKYGREHKW